MSKTSNKKGLLKDFSHFVEYHTDLDEAQRMYVTSLFVQPHIKKTVRVSLILFVWAFFATFVDSMLLSSGIITSLVEGFRFVNFLPSFFFLVFNVIGKLVFIQWFDVNGHFNRTQRILASLPSIGVILFLSDVFRMEKLFLKVIRSYLKYVRRRGTRFILNLLSLRTNSQ
jgi:hypothetical protein